MPKAFGTAWLLLAEGSFTVPIDRRKYGVLQVGRNNIILQRLVNDGDNNAFSEYKANQDLEHAKKLVEEKNKTAEGKMVLPTIDQFINYIQAVNPDVVIKYH